jgi:hypothetical protein
MRRDPVIEAAVVFLADLIRRDPAPPTWREVVGSIKPLSIPILTAQPVTIFVAFPSPTLTV